MWVNFELLDLRAFLAILEQGSFGKAAAILNISQPALSRRIQALEEAIGSPLFERTTRHVAPTLVGRSFAPRARNILNDVEETVIGMHGSGAKLSGQITIACVPTAAFHLLPRAIQRFNEKFPRIRFRILDVSANEGLESVRKGEAEFGINFIGGSEPELCFTPMVEDEFVLVCRKDHPLAAKRQLRWKDLEGHALIGVSRASGNRLIMENALGSTGVSVGFLYEVNHLTTSLGLVEQGLGLAVVTRLAAPRDGHPILLIKSLREPSVKRTIGLLERRSGSLSPAAQRFREMLLKPN
jgi:DNA-binding transcriptional LysR family regulator